MHLAELSRTTGATTSSIKYWIREGILPPGAKRHATSAEYDRRHVDRTELIGVLRTELRVPMSGIADLTALLDDPDVDFVVVQEQCQVLALGLHRPPGPMIGPEHEKISALCEELGWPDLPSWAREELAAILHEYPGVDSDGWLRHYAHALDSVAKGNVAVTSSSSDASRDRNAIDTLRGVALTLRVERAISAMAHASASITRLSGGSR